MFLKFSFQPSWLNGYRWDLTVVEPKRLNAKKISLFTDHIDQISILKMPAHHHSPAQCATSKSSATGFSCKK